MKKFIKNSILTIAVVTALVSCTKYDSNINAAANATTAGLSSSSLNNRVVSGFVVDANTIPNLPAGNLPTPYNSFRKLLTYDTVATVNKTPVYKVGDTINVVAYMKGDDSAIAKRKINFRFFKAPTAFITPANPPTVINVMQRAEDSYRGFAPAAGDILDTKSLAAIVSTNVAPFNVFVVANENVNGINYNTYLVRLAYIIPATYVSGTVVSINFTANTAGAANDLGNVNWIYAFRIK
jgi:hypothetical protein